VQICGNYSRYHRNQQALGVRPYELCYSNPTGVVTPLGRLPLPDAVPLGLGAKDFTTGVGLL